MTLEDKKNRIDLLLAMDSFVLSEICTRDALWLWTFPDGELPIADFEDVTTDEEQFKFTCNLFVKLLNDYYKREV